MRTNSLERPQGYLAGRGGGPACPLPVYALGRGAGAGEARAAGPAVAAVRRAEHGAGGRPEHGQVVSKLLQYKGTIESKRLLLLDI